MREGRASTTAEGVAFFRGIASLVGSPFDGVDDPIAEELLDGPFRVALGAVRRLPALSPIARLASLGLCDHVALRTRTIDEAVRRAARNGATQLVILGAGLDARAFRMPELERAIAFEVDFPATQAHKRARLGERRPLAREVRFVAIDFERDSLDERLASVGHDASDKTIWVWEGVTPYLVRAAIEGTMEVVSRRSAIGSTLAVSYITPELARVEPSRDRGAFEVPRPLLPLLKGAFALVGEPVRSPIERDAMGALLARHGLTVASDGGSPEWAKAHPPRGRTSRVVITERVAVAMRT